jgi:NAD(P)-dependent dehydrogenase (short-subunit alcohol dehydrogenase family)
VQLADTIVLMTGAAAYYRHDVTSETDWAHIAGEIKAKYGRLDCLVVLHSRELRDR